MLLNLLHRLAVKTLVDKSSLGIIDDGCPELENFITILEHIFNHRLKRETAVFFVSASGKTQLKMYYRLKLCLR